MSHFIQLSLSWNDSDRVAGSLRVDEIIEAARSFVIEQQWSEHVLEDLRNACGSALLGQPAFNGVMSFGVIELVRSVSERLPDVTFYAKGSGEEFWDLWLREFKAGAVVRERGPFEEYADPIPPDLLAQARAAATAAAESASKETTAKSPNWLSRLLNR